MKKTLLGAALAAALLLTIAPAQADTFASSMCDSAFQRDDYRDTMTYCGQETQEHTAAYYTEDTVDLKALDMILGAGSAMRVGWALSHLGYRAKAHGVFEAAKGMVAAILDQPSGASDDVMATARKRFELIVQYEDHYAP